MFNWLRKFFSTFERRDSRREVHVDDGESASYPDQNDYKPIPLDKLFVQPDDTEDFDREACQRLIATIAKFGVKNVDEIDNVVVSIEEFFEGNRCKHSIAGNVVPAPPYDTAESWYELLKKIRANDAVEDVVVEIHMIEPYEDGRVGIWSYSDTIWIYSSLDRDTITSFVAPLEPDEVRDASLNDPNWDLTPPLPVPDGMRPYWVWWD